MEITVNTIFETNSLLLQYELLEKLVTYFIILKLILKIKSWRISVPKNLSYQELVLKSPQKETFIVS